MVGEGEKSGCECGAGETAGEVGVGDGEGACRGGAVGGSVEKKLLVLLSLHVFEFLPSGLALCNGEPNSAGDSSPVGTKFWIFFEFDQATISVAVPSVPICVLVRCWWWWLTLACCGGLWIRGSCWSVVRILKGWC